jgi:hypothetical protein
MSLSNNLPSENIIKINFPLKSQLLLYDSYCKTGKKWVSAYDNFDQLPEQQSRNVTTHTD